MDNQKQLTRLFFAATLLLFLGGCAEMQTGGTSGGTGLEKETTSHYRFSDVPVPGKFKLDREKSFVYETGNNKVKVGRLLYSGTGKIEEVAAFYQGEMPGHGWALVRSMELSGATLLYEKQGWSCMIAINSSFGQSTIEIQVGPK